MIEDYRARAPSCHTHFRKRSGCGYLELCYAACVLRLIRRSLAAGALLIPLLGADAAVPTDSPQPVQAHAAPTAPDPVEAEYQRLLELDDAVAEEVDRWIREEMAQRSQGVGLSDVTLRARIFDRFRPVRQGYEDFLTRHPRHARGHLAFGSFLNEIGEEELAVEHMEKSRELDPANPAAWNNLANHYGHRGPVRKAFEYYAQAIELNPEEPVYYQNLAVAVYLFRRDAEAFYALDEPAVFEKALQLYRQAMQLDPQNFVLATEYAESFYGMLPRGQVDRTVHAEKTRQITDRAIEAWQAALALAQDDLQRQGVLIHLARNRFLSGRYDQAAADLVPVTHEALQTLKSRIQRNIDDGRGKEP